MKTQLKVTSSLVNRILNDVKFNNLSNTFSFIDTVNNNTLIEEFVHDSIEKLNEMKSLASNEELEIIKETLNKCDEILKYLKLKSFW